MVIYLFSLDVFKKIKNGVIFMIIFCLKTPIILFFKYKTKDMT